MRREPFGMVILPLVSAFSNGWAIGWASTPYDPEWERRHPRRAAWMAAAGPGANLALALAALAALRAGVAAEWFYAPERAWAWRMVASETPLLDGIGVLLSILLVLNVLLFLFNLLPVPPLDGASVATLLMPDDLALRFRETLAANPLLGVGALLLAWFLFGEVFEPVFSGLLRWVHSEVSYS